MNILGFFTGLLKRAFNFAKDTGLTDDVVDLARGWVREVAKQNIDNTAKREQVVAVLVSKGVKENIARIAVELAYLLYKREIAPKL